MIYNLIPDFSKQLVSGKRLIGLDIGAARIGIAISDVNRIIATPHSVYEHRNMRQDLGHINGLITAEDACGVVIGLPLTMAGKEEDNCLKIRSFAEKLHKKNGLPIFLQDERMSTAAVTRALQEYDMTRKKRQAVDDKLAASYILQCCLDSIK